MKILGIIPARYNSTRFPGKPLVEIAGLSMIQRVYNQAKKSKLLSKVIIATDDDRIYKHVLSFTDDVVMTNENHINGTSRCGEVIEKFTGYEVVINIQGDEPLVKPEQIDKLLSAFENPKVNIATLIKKITDYRDLENENRIKVVINHTNKALYFSRSAIPFYQGKQLNKWLDSNFYFKHIGIYAWKTSCLKEILNLPIAEIEKNESLEQLRWLYYGYDIFTIETDIETPNVDTPQDIEAVIRALNSNN